MSKLSKKLCLITLAIVAMMIVSFAIRTDDVSAATSKGTYTLGNEVSVTVTSGNVYYYKLTITEPTDIVVQAISNYYAKLQISKNATGTDIVGSMTTTSSVTGGSLYLPAGTYYVLLNASTYYDTTFAFVINNFKVASDYEAISLGASSAKYEPNKSYIVSLNSTATKDNLINNAVITTSNSAVATAELYFSGSNKYLRVKTGIQYGTAVITVKFGGKTVTYTVSTKATDAISLSSKSGKLTGQSKKVGFTLNWSPSTLKGLTVTSSNTKVATATINVSSYYTSSSYNYITVTPATKMGTSVISINLNNTVVATYTVTANEAYVYVAKGSTYKLPKPSGVKGKLTYKSKKKSIATVSKKGKVKGKKDGKVKVTLKNKKKTYTYNIIVTDYTKLAKRAYRLIKDNVPNPANLKINDAYQGTYKISFANGSKIRVPVVYLDCTYENSSGGKSRYKAAYCWDETHTIISLGNIDYGDIAKRKNIKKSKIK